MQPILSITIPTFNRAEFLKQTLDILLPQMTTDVEVVIFDNCSTDGTEEYVRSLGKAVQYIRQESNIGSDRNMVSCLTQAFGDYLWLLCDDDIPCTTAVQRILEGIKSFPNPPMLSLRVIPGDKYLSNFDPKPVETGWTSFNRNEFIADISFLFTCAPLIVVRRECLDIEFVEKSIGTNLVAAAVVLSTAGRHYKVIRPNKPLLFGRMDNSGGYDAIKVFGENLIKLFKRCDSRWFDRHVIALAYNDNIAIALNPAMRDALQLQKIPWGRIVSLIRYTYRYSYFYKNLMPTLSWQLTKRYILRRK